MNVLSQNKSHQCLCSFHEQPTFYRTEEELTRHVNLTRNWNPSLMPAGQHPVFITEELVDTHLLRDFQLALNVEHKIVVCLSCFEAINPERIAPHVSRQHKRSLPIIEHNTLRLLFSFFGIRSDMPMFDEENIPSTIDGISIHKGFACSMCPIIYSNMDQLNKHVKSSHPTGVLKAEAKISFSVQRFKIGKHVRYFRIRPKEATKEKNAIDLAVDALAELSKPIVVPDINTSTDVRNVCPWLRHIRWQNLVEGRKITYIRQLVAYLLDDDFPGLGQAVFAVFLKATTYFVKMPDLILQQLNTPDETKPEHYPFDVMQDHEKSLKKYSNSVICLIAMLLRGSTVPLTPEIDAIIFLLNTSISSGAPQRNISEVAFKLLCHIWRYEWLPITNHRIHDPTMVYLGFSSLEEQGTFQEAKLVTQPISHFNYCIRLTILTLIHKDGTKGISEAFKKQEYWVQEKNECTFRSLCSAQHIATSIAYSTKSLPKVWWTDRINYREMLYRGTPLKMEQVQAMLEAAENEIQLVWEQEVTLSLGLRVDYSLLHDDLASRQLGYSFITDKRNKFFSQNETTLLRGILSNPALHQRFIVLHNNGVVRWHFRALRDWLAGYARFEKLLLGYVHITAGSPARTTELTATPLVNTELYPLRGLVAFGTHISLLCTYVKTSALSGTDKLLPHALSAFGADILIQDLCLAHLFARLAANIVHSNDESISKHFQTHIFVNHTKLFNSDDLTSCLRKMAAPHMGVDLNVSTWCHIFTAFHRKLCTQLEDLIELDELESVEVLQMGHSKQTEKRVYGLSPHALQDASEDILPLFLDASTEWQIRCSLVPGGITLPYSAAKMESFKTLVSNNAIRIPENHQTLSLLRTLLLRIEELEKKLQNQTDRDPLQAIFNRIDQLENRLLDQYRPDVTLVADAVERRSVESIPILESNTIDRHTQQAIDHRFNESLPQANLSKSALGALRRLLNDPTATWKSPEQEAAVLAALKGDQDLLAVLPTGSGKSMIALIPPFLEDNKLTVLIVPLRVLLLDYKRKLIKMGIPFEIYESECPLSGTKSLVIVSADCVKLDSWNEVLAAVHRRRAVHRQIVDEAHIPLLSQNFRRNLRNMSDIRCNIPCQTILLTASASKKMEDHLFDVFCLSPSTLVLHVPSNRPELAYTWKTIREQELLDFVSQLINEHVQKPQHRAIIFVQMYAEGEEVSDKLSLPFYHGGDKLSNDDREEIFSNWQRGDPATCVATSAFGTSNDCAHVRLVVHIGFAYEMTNYIQEAARAGRDGLSAQCCMLQYRGLPKHARVPPDDPDLHGRQDILLALANPELCVRFSLTAFVDGKGMYCSDDPRNQFCNRCVISKKASHSRPFIEQQVAAKRIRMERKTQRNAYDQNFEQCLSHFSNVCTFCHAYEQTDDRFHPINQCPTMPNKNLFYQWRGKLRYDSNIHKNKICYMCQVPQGEEDGLHPSFTGVKSDCPHPDIIAPIAYSILRHNRLREEASRAFPSVDWSEDSNVISWLIGHPVKGHYTNISALFLWYAQHSLV